MIPRVDNKERRGLKRRAFVVLNNLRVCPPASKDLQFSPVGRNDRGVAKSEWSMPMHNQNFGLIPGPFFTKNGVQRKGTPSTKQVDHLPELDHANLQHKVYLI